MRGNAHTNTVEGFFGLLKRGITACVNTLARAISRSTAMSSAFAPMQASDAQRAGMLVAAAEGKRLTYKQPA